MKKPCWRDAFVLKTRRALTDASEISGEPYSACVAIFTIVFDCANALSSDGPWIASEQEIATISGLGLDIVNGILASLDHPDVSLIRRFDAERGAVSRWRDFDDVVAGPRP